MTWPAVLLWLYFIGAALSPGPALLYAFAVAGAFQTLQMLPGEALGGANLLPQSICAVFLIGKFLARRGNLAAGVAAALDMRRLGLLFAFLLYAVATAFILPLLFRGLVTVITVVAPITGLSLLNPSSQNVTQSAYMSISALVCAVFAVLGKQERFREHYLISLLYGALALIGSGLLDLVTYKLGLTALLDPFRNVSYALLADVETAGAKRVVGFMPEASAYGAACLASGALLAFLRPVFPPHLRSGVVPLLTFGLLGMTALSTSSGALVCLVIFAALYLLNACLRANDRSAPDRRAIEWEVALVLVGSFLLYTAVVVMPNAFDPIVDLIRHMVFEKTQSNSYIERSHWTSVAMDAFWQSSTWGVGLGGIRSSNWAVSILSSTGLIGAVLLFSFIALQFLISTTSHDPMIHEWRRGIRFSLIPPLVISWLSGTIPDIGATAGALYGLIAATTDEPKEEDVQSSSRDVAALRPGAHNV